MRTIAEEVQVRLKTAGLAPIGVEGAAEGTWILIDFVDVVVHVFQPSERDFYRLDRLWSDAPRLPLPEAITGAGAAQPSPPPAEDTDDQMPGGLPVR